VADAVEARRQDMHQKAADELVRGKRHHLVVSLLAFETIILPLEGNVLVVGRDQAPFRLAVPQAAALYRASGLVLWPISAQARAAACPQLAKADAASGSPSAAQRTK
jgi:hypothetical protein